jgi:hypothetical protein
MIVSEATLPHALDLFADRHNHNDTAVPTDHGDVTTHGDGTTHTDSPD